MIHYQTIIIIDSCSLDGIVDGEVARTIIDGEFLILSYSEGSKILSLPKGHGPEFYRRVNRTTILELFI